MQSLTSESLSLWDTVQSERGTQPTTTN